MEQDKRGILSIAGIVIGGCAIMAYVDAVLVPSYTVKSLIKLALFLILPLIYSLVRQRPLLRSLFTLHGKRAFLEPLFLGVAVYGVILGGFCWGTAHRLVYGLFFAQKQQGKYLPDGRLYLACQLDAGGVFLPGICVFDAQKS